MVLRLVLAAGLLTVGIAPARPAPSAAPDRSTLELVGVFPIGAQISGAAMLDGYLYATTTDRLSIYDVSNPTLPTLVGWAPSPHAIYGELISTDGQTLLLNDGLVAGTVDIWNVEDKTNPVLEASLVGINDEHISCLLDCSWAYGSSGTIIELRRKQPIVHDENWLLKTHGNVVHRIDEYRHGFMATAPRADPPKMIDVRNPLKPRVIATANTPGISPTAYLYTTWLRKGRDRFAISSGEMNECDEKWRGALTTFDTKGWERTKRLRPADSYRYRGRADSEDNQCTSYYFSTRPGFRNGGTVLLPQGLEGVRLVNVDGKGEIEEVDSFVPPLADIWLTFWLDKQLFYALSATGEVYVLRYVP